MLAAARRLGASIVLLALVYQGRSVLEARAGGVSEVQSVTMSTAARPRRSLHRDRLYLSYARWLLQVAGQLRKRVAAGVRRTTVHTHLARRLGQRRDDCHQLHAQLHLSLGALPPPP